MRMRRVSALALSALLVGGLAACGDDGEDSKGEAGLEAVDDDTTTTTDGDDATAVDLDDFDPEDFDPEDFDLGDLDFGSIPGVSEECALFAEASLAFAGMFAGVAGGMDADMGTVADAMAAFASSAPAEIAADVAILAEAFERFAEEIGDVDLSDMSVMFDPAMADRLERAGALFETPEFEAANDRITAYVDEHCGMVDLG